jgi:hypothetical protein
VAYDTNAVKQDPLSGMCAQKTNSPDPDRAWKVHSMAGPGHFVPERYLDGWDDMVRKTDA